MCVILIKSFSKKLNKIGHNCTWDAVGQSSISEKLKKQKMSKVSFKVLGYYYLNMDREIILNNYQKKNEYYQKAHYRHARKWLNKIAAYSIT